MLTILCIIYVVPIHPPLFPMELKRALNMYFSLSSSQYNSILIIGF